jgi:hypothetical protein
MIRRQKWVSGLLLALCAACSSTSGPAGGGSGSDGGSGGSPGLGGALCSSSSPCPTGEFCFNGICAYGCTADSDCASNQYCDTSFSKTCQDKSGPSECSSDSDCATNQTCISGLCSVVPAQPTQCTPPPGANDGCDMNSVCVAGQNGQANSCLTFPPCGEDGSCPVGANGAVCNEGYIQGKGRFCMPGLCKDASDCPASDSCVPITAGAPIGECSNGAAGETCDATHSCQSGLSCQTVPGYSGICAPGLPSGGEGLPSGSECAAPEECASGTCNMPDPSQPGTCQ